MIHLNDYHMNLAKSRKKEIIELEDMVVKMTGIILNMKMEIDSLKLKCE